VVPLVTRLATDQDRRSCRHCDSYVTDEFRRVFGDDSNTAHRCLDCDTFARVSQGSAAGLSVTTPDPETSKGRHGGEMRS
jgi:RNase P subunit RPR2